MGFYEESIRKEGYTKALLDVNYLLPKGSRLLVFASQTQFA